MPKSMPKHVCQRIRLSIRLFTYIPKRILKKKNITRTCYWGQTKESRRDILAWVSNVWSEYTISFSFLSIIPEQINKLFSFQI